LENKLNNNIVAGNKGWINSYKQSNSELNEGRFANRTTLNLESLIQSNQRNVLLSDILFPCTASSSIPPVCTCTPETLKSNVC
jgi:hypothetical protein